jgi:hypothetical protein
LIVWQLKASSESNTVLYCVESGGGASDHVLSSLYRNTAMAPPADLADQERAGPGRPVPADLPRHHRFEAAHRDGRRQRR